MTLRATREGRCERCGWFIIRKAWRIAWMQHLFRVEERDRDRHGLRCRLRHASAGLM